MLVCQNLKVEANKNFKNITKVDYRYISISEILFHLNFYIVPNKHPTTNLDK